MYWFCQCCFRFCFLDSFILQDEKAQALKQVIQIQQQLLELQQANSEIDRQRMEAISQSYPLACRGALETIWADFKDRHDRSSICSVSLNNATTFFQHWLACRFVDFHTCDYVLQVQDISGRVVATSSQAGVERELPHMYNTLSSLAHVVVPPAAASEMILPKQLSGDQACALATILKRHHFQHVYYQSWLYLYLSMYVRILFALFFSRRSSSSILASFPVSVQRWVLMVRILRPRTENKWIESALGFWTVS